MMSGFRVVFNCVLAVWMCSLVVSGLNSTNVVIPGLGSIQGFNSPFSIYNFLGIPYAQSTAGSMRWKPPVAVNGYSNFQATSFGPICPQIASSFNPILNGTNISEDCLSLNIFAPPTPGLKPVMIWIHGGGLINGASANPPYNGNTLALTGNIVVVTINYRVGALGFLGHTALYAESGNTTTGNYGLFDQQLAIRWVHDNIIFFGGDPSKVTIAGESAGAATVLYQLFALATNTSSLPSNAVSQAIIESADPFFQVHSLQDAFNEGVTVQRDLNCSSSSDALSCLRSATLSQILSLSQFYSFAHVALDGSVLSAHPYTLIQTLDLSRFNVLIGSNLNEGSVFVYPVATTPVSSALYSFIVGQVLSNLGVNTNISSTNDVVQQYPCSSSDCRPALSDIFGDNTIICPTTFVADKFGDYVYLFARSTPGNPPEFGAFHFAEIPYVFSTLLVYVSNISSNDLALENTMTTFWSNFVRTGNPNTNGSNVWPSYNPNHERIYFNYTGNSVVTGYKEAITNTTQCGFWNTYYSKLISPNPSATQSPSVASPSASPTTTTPHSSGSHKLSPTLTSLLFSSLLEILSTVNSI